MRHGKDLTAARASYGTQDGGWLDQSTGNNPDAYLFTLPAETCWRRLLQAVELALDTSPTLMPSGQPGAAMDSLAAALAGGAAAVGSIDR